MTFERSDAYLARAQARTADRPYLHRRRGREGWRTSSTEAGLPAVGRPRAPSGSVKECMDRASRSGSAASLRTVGRCPKND